MTKESKEELPGFWVMVKSLDEESITVVSSKTNIKQRLNVVASEPSKHVNSSSKEIRKAMDKIMETEELKKLLGDRWSVLGPTLIERKSRIVSTCSRECGKSYTLSEFRKLQRSAGDKELLDMRVVDKEEPSFYWSRNCTCGSTIYVELDINQRVYDEKGRKPH